MISHVLPATVLTEYTHDDGPDPELFDCERALVARAVESRRAEFGTVRRLARRALSRLGRPSAPILPDRRGAPQWPDGVVGSMTHCAGYRAAAVATPATTASLGVDAETNAPLPDGILETVTLPSERAMLGFLRRGRPDVHWDRLYFSAKESVFKAWYPLTGRELDFDGAEIVVDPAGRFAAHLLVRGPTVGGERVDVFRGRWHADDGLLVTAVHLPALR